MSLSRAFATAVLSGALLTGAAALAPAASAAPTPSTTTPSVTTVSSTVTVVVSGTRTPQATGHLRVVRPTALNVVRKGHLR
ncbi:hypothetical protein GTR02_09805 [Kineococcus sp. R8]|uniref:hypothetical protein n=1 Tax=Kineococcus siccus TaxID=2696567 RepID=UPI0014136349|nr:hypothetical protein [Kineococcus siccus]NAZ82111.1 hypothetical protein [Kineococcus siccus]